MDDVTALRLKKIEMSMETAQRGAELRARLHLTIVAVALTIGGTAGVAFAAGQLGSAGLLWTSVVVGAVVVSQVRELARLTEALDEANRRAAESVDTLMVEGGEQDVDEEEGDRGAASGGDRRA